jgi:hypothetical protein
LSVATIGRRVAAISTAHRRRNLQSPTRDEAVRIELPGIRLEHGVAPKKKAAAVIDVMRAMVEPLGDRAIDVRDRTFLLIGLAGAFRRSELVALPAAPSLSFTMLATIPAVRRVVCTAP